MGQRYVKFFYDWIEQTAALSDAERGRLFIAILEYARSGLDPKLDGREGILFPVFRGVIDRDGQKSRTNTDNIKKRWGKARAEADTNGYEAGTNEYEPIRTDTTEYEAIPTKDRRQKTKDIRHSPPRGVPPSPPEHLPASAPKKPRKAAAVRHEYGAYRNVLLSDEDLAKLREEFPDWEARIERLSEYIASTGKAYKSHLATIRAWARKDAEARGKPAQRPGKRWQTAEEYDRNAPGDLEKAAVRRMMGDG